MYIFTKSVILPNITAILNMFLRRSHSENARVNHPLCIFEANSHFERFLSPPWFNLEFFFSISSLNFRDSFWLPKKRILNRDKFYETFFTFFAVS
jgi:hypothetical protein